MATVTSHALNGVDGTHAGGIAVTLSRIETNGPTAIFSRRLDDGGRLAEEVDLTGADADATYELRLATGPYWDERGIGRAERRVLREIVLRFQMPDRHKRYHLPVILAPNSYTAWFSD